MEYKIAFEAAKRNGQDQVFSFWNELSEYEQQELLQQLETVDYNFLAQLFAKTKEEESGKLEGLTPPKAFDKYSVEKKIKDAKDIGEEAISKGKFALFIVAGGQGSRLGFEGPKGCFPITPIKKKSFFQVYAQKVLATEKKYNCKLDVYIMTSKTNDADTRSFFAEHDFFGLEKNQVVFFSQDMIPSLDHEGKLLLEEKHKIFENPNGHGGIYEALVKNGITKRMKEKGIEYVSFINVDNVLVEPFDPTYFGLVISEDAEVGTKVVEKNSSDEKVGLVVNDNTGITRIVEYVNVDKELTEEKNNDGSLRFSAGNLNILVLRRDFIERIVEESDFAYLVQNKKIPYIDVNTGDKIIPETNNGYKFERLVFDAFPFANTVTTVYTKREVEFAPVKNATGRDSVESAVEMQNSLFKSWLINAGFEEEKINALEDIEISPLYALTEKDFLKRSENDKDKIQKILETEERIYLE